MFLLRSRPQFRRAGDLLDDKSLKCGIFFILIYFGARGLPGVIPDRVLVVCLVILHEFCRIELRPMWRCGGVMVNPARQLEVVTSPSLLRDLPLFSRDLVASAQALPAFDTTIVHTPKGFRNWGGEEEYIG